MFAKGVDSQLIEKRKSISDVDIASYYLGITKIPTRMCSPLRRDKKPSFGLYSRDGEHIYYIDFATGDKGSIIELLMQLWNKSYNETWEKIVSEIGHANNINVRKVLNKPKIEILDHVKTNIKIVIRDWEEYDLKYWASYGITKDWLEFADIYPISYILFYKENQEPFALKADKLAYAYVEFKENTTTYKIYQPLNKNGSKWFSSHDRSVISLWTKVPEFGEKIVICSSMKDALCLWANANIPSLALQGEGYGMSETAINELKKRYKKIYICFDNDEAGLKDGKKLAANTNFTNAVLPFFTDGKDVSDLFKSVGKKEFLSIINQLFN